MPRERAEMPVTRRHDGSCALVLHAKIGRLHAVIGDDLRGAAIGAAESYMCARSVRQRIGPHLDLYGARL